MTREDTFDLSEGLGKVRWSDDLSQVEKVCARHARLRPFSGRNPKTHDPIVVKAGLAVGGLVRALDVDLPGAVMFNDAGQIESIAVGLTAAFWTHDFAELDATADEAGIEAAYRALCERLGVKPGHCAKHPQGVQLEGEFGWFIARR